jgi:dTDP-4-dehydrorhamnose reductase
MKRLMVTGANGLVGQVLIDHLRKTGGFDILATSASGCRIKDLTTDRFRQMDITDPVETGKVTGEFQPHCIVHCAAISQVDACEQDPSLCDLVNIEGTRNVVRAAEAVGAQVICLSTDFVFDGLKGPYSEEDQPNPVSLYGWSKLQAELITMSARVPAAIVRTILVYGVAPGSGRTNLVTWVCQSLREGKSIRVVDDQYRMPTFADDLAEGIISIARLGKTGIYHLSGPEMTSVYDFAVKTALYFSLDESLISPVSSDSLNQLGRRPAVTRFILDKARKELQYYPRNLDEGLAMVRNLLDNKLD